MAAATQAGRQTYLQHCPACGTALAAAASTAPFKIDSDAGPRSFMTCSSCGLGMVYPLPTASELADIYDAAYLPYQFSDEQIRRQSGGIRLLLARWRFERFVAPSLLARFRWLMALLCEAALGRSSFPTFGVPLLMGKQDRILDFGYGNGSWLLMMQKLGYRQLLGYDIASNQHNAGRLVSREIRVLSSLDAAAEECSAARLEQVAEHLTDPFQTLLDIGRALKPDGYLLINVPCRRSLVYSWFFPADQRLIQIPKHLFHHTQESIRLMLARAGFTVTDVFIHPHLEVLMDAIVRKIPALQPIRLPARTLGFAYYALAKIFRRGEFVSAIAVKRS